MNAEDIEEIERLTRCAHVSMREAERGLEEAKNDVDELWIYLIEAKKKEGA